MRSGVRASARVLRGGGRLWRAASAAALLLVGGLAKLVMSLLTRTTVVNGAALRRAVARADGRPLLTVANHHSCLDDPGLWGVLPWRALLRWRRLRWTLAAQDICFTSSLGAAFFALGRCVPVVRGAGVHQPAIDFCIEKLLAGEWVHLFPEGRVNVDQQPLRFKWGVGRLVAACWAGGRPPLLLPVWHEGMDGLLPNHSRRPRLGQSVLVLVGEPIRTRHLIVRLKKRNASEEETRRVLTEHIQDEMLKLRARAHALLRGEGDPGGSACGGGERAQRDTEHERAR